MPTTTGLTAWEIQREGYMVRMEAAGYDRSFSLVLAECGLRGDKAVYRVVREALAQYMAPARVTAGNLMQRTVTYPAPVPWQPSAPVMPTAEQPGGRERRGGG